jgi:hypothetical protein
MREASNIMEPSRIDHLLVNSINQAKRYWTTMEWQPSSSFTLKKLPSMPF